MQSYYNTDIRCFKVYLQRSQQILHATGHYECLWMDDKSDRKAKVLRQSAITSLNRTPAPSDWAVTLEWSHPPLLGVSLAPSAMVLLPIQHGVVQMLPNRGGMRQVLTIVPGLPLLCMLVIRMTMAFYQCLGDHFIPSQTEQRGYGQQTTVLITPTSIVDSIYRNRRHLNHAKVGLDFNIPVFLGLHMRTS
jgi:hypothetical protein